MSMEQLRVLYKELEIIEPYAFAEYLLSNGNMYPEIFSESELSEFEEETKIILPSGYRDFCKVFGSGCFGDDFLAIHCPSKFWVESMSPSKRSSITESLQSSQETLQSTYLKSLELINSAFVFGGQDYFSLFWDLRTYRKSDDSYDIYWALDEPYNGEIYNVGRDFSMFVRDFCLGDDLLNKLPPEFHEHMTEISSVFTHYPRFNM
ncbi:MAG: SMI1/KNR4 family protein [Cyanobacteria bacterium J06631_12]